MVLLDAAQHERADGLAQLKPELLVLGPLAAFIGLTQSSWKSAQA
ncbi:MULTISPECIES: hypothetical protein [Cellulomonas]|nr:MULTISPECIES: hypothetical protein [Cellulomonas]